MGVGGGDAVQFGGGLPQVRAGLRQQGWQGGQQVVATVAVAQQVQPGLEAAEGVGGGGGGRVCHLQQMGRSHERGTEPGNPSQMGHEGVEDARFPCEDNDIGACAHDQCLCRVGVKVCQSRCQERGGFLLACLQRYGGAVDAPPLKAEPGKEQQKSGQGEQEG